MELCHSDKHPFVGACTFLYMAIHQNNQCTDWFFSILASSPFCPGNINPSTRCNVVPFTRKEAVEAMRIYQKIWHLCMTQGMLCSYCFIDHHLITHRHRIFQDFSPLQEQMLCDMQKASNPTRTTSISCISGLGHQLFSLHRVIFHSIRCQWIRYHSGDSPAAFAFFRSSTRRVQPFYHIHLDYSPGTLPEMVIQSLIMVILEQNGNVIDFDCSLLPLKMQLQLMVDVSSMPHVYNVISCTKWPLALVWSILVELQAHGQGTISHPAVITQ